MSGQEKILVVEDEVKIRDVLSMYLKKEGFTVLETDNGKNALALIEKEKPALIVLDLMLPGISGLELCRRIKAQEETKNICVVILSAKGQEWEKTEGYEVGADLYETKPFSPKQLIDNVKMLLRKGRGIR